VNTSSGPFLTHAEPNMARFFLEKSTIYGLIVAY
jgi:hypothetical protein